MVAVQPSLPEPDRSSAFTVGKLHVGVYGLGLRGVEVPVGALGASSSDRGRACDL